MGGENLREDQQRTTSMNDDTDDSDRWVDWPSCPACDQRRQTFCPTCDLAADDFRLAEYIPASEPIAAGTADGGPAEQSAGCCGESACGPSRGGGDGSEACGPEPQAVGESQDGVTAGQETLPVLLFCPACSEAFVPRFFRFCARCGHDFGEGREIGAAPHSEVNSRVLFTMLVLFGLAIAAMVYFWVLFR
jgi:hypothetical protein